MTDLTRERVKAAIESLNNAKDGGDYCDLIERHEETIRQALSEREKLLECISVLAGDIKDLEPSFQFSDGYQTIITLARKESETP